MQRKEYKSLPPPGQLRRSHPTCLLENTLTAFPSRSMSRRPAPIDTENARAPQDPQEESSSGRRSGRLAGDNLPQHVWGSNPEDARRRNNNQGGLTSFLSSMIPGTREDTLPVHNPTAGQAPQSFSNASSVRNTPLPPPPQQSRGSTSVPPATAAATSSASTSERRDPGIESDPAPPTSEQRNSGTESNPAPRRQGSGTTSNLAPPTSEQQNSGTESNPAPSGRQGSGTTSNLAPPTSEQQNLGTESNPAPSGRQGSGTTSNLAPPTSEQQNLGTESNPAPSGRQGSGTTSNLAPPNSEQQNLGTESNPAPSGRQGSGTTSDLAPPTTEQRNSGTTPDLVSSTALQRPPQPRRSASVVNNETRSQPPSLGDRTAAPSPNMPQQPQRNTETRQQLSLRWTELPEEDQNKLPSELDLAALRTVFRLAAVGPNNIRGGHGNNSYRNCASCHEELIDGVGYVRCGHPMHWLCIQRGGLDGGCPVCLARAAVRPRPPPPAGTRAAVDNEECVLCSATLTPNDHIRFPGCGCEVHEDCIISGALANGCPFCRGPVPNWHEVATIDLTNSPPPGQTNGGIPMFGGPLVGSPTAIGIQTRNEERDRLLSELFHVHPDLWHLFTEEQNRLREIQNEANFDLDGWLNDFRVYNTVPGSSMTSILLRWQFAEYRPNLNIQDPQIRGVVVGSSAVTFYNSIRTTVDSLVNNGMGEDPARVAFSNANQTRPQHSGNDFHPNFWLPHERMRRRANTDGDRESVRLHMRRYIDRFHNHPILIDLFLPTGEPSENGTTQSNNGDRGPLPNATGPLPNATGPLPNAMVQRSSRPVFGPRPGWVYYDGVEKQIRGFRAIDNGFQILLRIPAPREGFWDHELIASHHVGAEITIDDYKRACEDRGEEPYLFVEGNLELLRWKTREQVRIVSRSVFRRYGRPPAGGYINAPMQHLEIQFTDEVGTFWYRKSRLEEKFTRPFVDGLLTALYRDSGISPVLFSPSETRERAPRIPSTSQALRPNTATTRQPLPTVQPTNPTVQPTNPTVQPTNPTVQPTNPTVQPTNPTAPGGLEARMTRMEQMMTQMMALLVMGGRNLTPESLGG
jgi:hypothetical protein